MRAVRIHQHGGPEVFQDDDIPVPVLQPDQVRVRVQACALNHLDLWVRAGIPGIRFALPHVLGSDIAGEVVETGSLCSRIQTGARVLLSPGLSCRQCAACVSGRDNLCDRYTLFGTGVPGGNQEFVTAPEYAALSIPETLDFVRAAAAPLVFLTAWHMLMTRARLEAGDDVLVLAASSGVGMAAIQIAKLFHCRVIATAGSEAKLGKARALGADFVIDHYRQDIAAEVKRITARRGVDIVVEHVGTATWGKSLASLARGGRVVTCGATTGFDAAVDLRHLFAKEQSLLGSYMGTLGELHRVMKFIFSGQLQPVVDQVYALTDLAEAHRYVENSQQFGKVVVVP